MRRRCAFVMPGGQQCRAAPLRDGSQCFLHDADHADEAAEARRLGGLRRRREGTLEVVYDLAGLESVEGLRRLLEIIVTDTLGLENGVARLRVLIAVVNAAAKLMEARDLEGRLAALEAIERTRRPHPAASGSAEGLLDGTHQ